MDEIMSKFTIKIKKKLKRTVFPCLRDFRLLKTYKNKSLKNFAPLARCP